LEPDQLLLMTLRSHDQFNTTIYGLDDRYRGIHGGRRVIFLNEADIERLHLTAGQKVDITSHFKGETRIVEAFTVVPYPIPPQCAAGYYPEMNPLAPICHASDGSNQPAYKSILITVASSAQNAP
ncbi:MAG: molybdopterin dinucleotide binding domain-containing protein, partial [bacterium]